MLVSWLVLQGDSVELPPEMVALVPSVVVAVSVEDDEVFSVVVSVERPEPA